MAVGLRQQIMKVFFLQVCLFTGCVFADNGFTWKNCDSNTPVQIEKLSLSPTTVPLRRGAKITFGSTVEVKDDTGVDYKVSLDIQKKIGTYLFPVWITLPCMSNFGSCTYDDLKCCDIWKVLNEPAHCPIPKGMSFHLPEATITLPEVKLSSLLTPGTYWARAKLENAENNKVLTCVEVNIEID